MALAPRRVLESARRLPPSDRRQFCEHMQDLTQFGGTVELEGVYTAALVGRTATIWIAGTVNCITDDDLSRIVRELAESVVTEVGA